MRMQRNQLPRFDRFAKLGKKNYSHPRGGTTRGHNNLAPKDNGSASSKSPNKQTTIVYLCLKLACKKLHLISKITSLTTGFHSPTLTNRRWQLIDHQAPAHTCVTTRWNNNVIPSTYCTHLICSVRLVMQNITHLYIRTKVVFIILLTLS